MTGQESLTGRVALVTGSSRGIGRAIALELAAAGADIAVNAGSQGAAAAEVVAEITGLGRRAVAVVGDIADPAEVGRLFGEIHEALGPVTVLVNNASIRPHAVFVDLEPEEWHRVLGVDLDGPFFCSRLAAHDMIDAGWGRIINISGRDGFTGAAGRAHVVVAKAGLHGLTKALALELGPSGITVNTIVPGAIDTGHRSEAELAARRAAIPVRRVGLPSDIARLCRSVIESPFVNGAAIHVNGGEFSLG